jgi:hypothetical protein
MNLFDNIQRQMFNTVSNVYGYDAIWNKSTGGTVTGRILLKEPTKEYDLNGVPFTPFNSIMEYQTGVFEGLFEAARKKTTETVTIGGVEFYVRHVEAVYDGRTYRADLEKINQ